MVQFTQERKIKSFKQLQKVQKRTNRYKTGEVHRKRISRFPETITSIPSQDEIRQEEPGVIELSNSIDKSWLNKMQKSSQDQKESLLREAAIEGRLPRVCVDRGVLQSEISADDPLMTSGDLDFDPSSVRLTLLRNKDWEREAKICKLDSIYGELKDKIYVSPSFSNCKGWENSHLQKVRKLSSQYFKNSIFLPSKNCFTDELASKTAQIKLSSKVTKKRKVIARIPMPRIPETMEVDIPLVQSVNGMEITLPAPVSLPPSNDEYMGLADYESSSPI